MDLNQLIGFLELHIGQPDYYQFYLIVVLAAAYVELRFRQIKKELRDLEKLEREKILKVYKVD